MLIRFRSPHAAEFLMFEDVARRLIALMGCGPQIPGAITAADIPAALARLRAGIAAEPEAVVPPSAAADEDDPPPVPFARRAVPLLAMLEAARDGESHVMWEACA